jgi:DNA-binding transcriptional LysR family regulator
VVLIEVRLLRYFAALAEEHSFTAAARRLHISQPSLSNQIRLMERRLGAPLIVRGSHPLVLTQVGEQVLAGAYRVLRAVDETEQNARAIATGQAGLLRIGFIHGGLYEIMLAALRSLRAELPAARFVPQQLRSEDQLTALRTGDVDVALYRRTHPYPLDGLASRPLRADRLIAVLPEDHPAARTGRVRLTDLAGESFVAFKRHHMPLVYDRCVQACRDAGFEPRIGTEFDDPLTLALAVGSGGHVALTGAGMSNRYPGLRYLPVDPPTFIADISVVWPAGRVSPLLAPFLATLDRHADILDRLSTGEPPATDGAP